MLFQEFYSVKKSSWKSAGYDPKTQTFSDHRYRSVSGYFLLTVGYRFGYRLVIFSIGAVHKRHFMVQRWGVIKFKTKTGKKSGEEGRRFKAGSAADSF